MRFVHTSDWQLGMTRHFLAGEAQARYTAARIDAIRAIGELARADAADMVVVAGDVFDSNLVSPATVQRALDAMASIGVPVYLLAGNHDALDAVSIYTSAVWRRHCPPNVHVLEQGLNVTECGAQIVAAPLRSNDPRADLLGRELDELTEPATVPRIAVGHGIVDVLDPSGANAAAMRLDRIERAISEGRVHYVALGDKHTRLAVGTTGRVHYSGASEVTSFREELPGEVLLVDVTADGGIGRVEVEPRHVGTWAFREVEQRLLGEADVEALDRTLTALDPKDRTVVRTKLVGTLTLRERALLDEVLERHGHAFAALFAWQRHEDIAVTMSGDDIENMHVSGFVESAARELAEAAASPADDSAAARDALSLLFRLAGGVRR
ncbi:MAG: DNA repair exonuclease [Dermatophilus congolensis]|nr:DNA repair exonuclease [Dermatophilus congolensis]